MKAVKAIVFVAVILLSRMHSNAQTGTPAASQRALLFADSLLKCFRANNLDQYIQLSYAGVIKYYGGKKSFENYIQRTRSISGNMMEETEKIQLLQIQHDSSEWQCVVQKNRETMIDGREAVVITYMVGQSKDEGLNWKFFDVAFNSVENVIYIMPDIFGTLAIPQRQIIFKKESLAVK